MTCYQSDENWRRTRQFTSVCRQWKETGRCGRGFECTFAHGVEKQFCQFDQDCNRDDCRRIHTRQKVLKPVPAVRQLCQFDQDCNRDDCSRIHTRQKVFKPVPAVRTRSLPPVAKPRSYRSLHKYDNLSEFEVRQLQDDELIERLREDLFTKERTGDYTCACGGRSAASQTRGNFKKHISSKKHQKAFPYHTFFY
jgi:hypothetical protein